MKLDNKKKLAARALGVGAGKVKFEPSRIDEIKEAITKQDIRDLVKSKAIIILPKKGRKTREKRKTRKRQGKVKIKVKSRKKDYVIITRKLRNYLKELRQQGKITNEKHSSIRKRIRMREFKSKRQLKEAMQ